MPFISFSDIDIYYTPLMLPPFSSFVVAFLSVISHVSPC